MKGEGLDADGYIRQLRPEAPLQRPFRPVVRAATQRLVDRLGDALHSLYLYGSVARRNAVPGRSDLDLTVLVREDLPRAALDPLGARLQAQYPVVSKIDFDVGTYATAVHPDHRFSWGFWLKHCCCNIVGPDIGRQFDPFKPDLRIAIALNGDVGEVTTEYVNRWMAADDAGEQARLQRELAKKILRSIASLVMPVENCWITDLPRSATLARTYFPAQEDVIDRLLDMARGESEATPEVRDVLLDAGRWAAEQFAAVDS